MSDIDEYEIPELSSYSLMLYEYRSKKYSEHEVEDPRQTISLDEKNSIKEKLRRAFLTLDDTPVIHGAYYENLWELGLKLDAGDEVLLAEECNQPPLRFMRDSMSNRQIQYEHIYNAMCHKYVLTFARLNNWADGVASEITVPTIPNVFPGSEETGKVGVISPKIETDDDGLPDEIVELTFCMETMFEKDSIFWLILRPKSGQLQTTLEDSWSMIERVTAECESAAQGKGLRIKPPPGKSNTEVDALIAESISSIISRFAQGIADRKVQPKTFSLIAAMLQAGFYADERICMAPIAGSMGELFSAVVNRVIEAPATGCEAFACESMYSAALEILGSLKDILGDSRPMHQYIHSDFEPSYNSTRYAEIFLECAPALVRGIGFHASPFLSFTALDALKTCTEVLLPDSLPLFLLKKPNWQIFTSLLCFDSATVDDVEISANRHCLELPDSTRIIRTERELRQFLKYHALDLFHKLCRRSLVISPCNGNSQSSVVMLGPVGKVLVKREAISLALKLLQRTEESEGGEVLISGERGNSARIGAMCLDCLTRCKDCRLIMLHPPPASELLDAAASEGKRGDDLVWGAGILNLLMNHDDFSVISHGMVIVLHLLWDQEWQALVADMKSPSLAAYVATWAAASIRCVEETSRHRRDVHRILALQNIQNSMKSDTPAVAQSFKSNNKKKKQKKKPPKGNDGNSGAIDNREKSTEELDYEAYMSRIPQQAERLAKTGYPIYDRHYSDAMVLLSRCILLCQSVVRIDLNLSNPDSVIYAMRKFRILDLLVSAIDLDLLDSDTYVLAGLTNFLAYKEFFPSDITHPQYFVHSLIARMYGNTPQEDLRQSQGDRADQKLFHMQAGILAHLFDPRVADAWAPYIEVAKLKQEDELSPIVAKRLEASILNSVKNMATSSFAQSPSMSSRREVVQVNAVASAPNQQLLVLNSCASCEKVEAKKKTFLVCSRCRNAHYCDRSCQRDHWSEHKKLCKKK